MTIVPDSKDWTWVLVHPCPDCGFTASTFDRAITGDTIRANAASWVEALNEPDAATRRNPARWSTLEYGCHVRDVFRLYLERLNLMLTTNDPLYANWDQDETAIAERYGTQDPKEVANNLVAAAHALADRFETVTEEQWIRTGRRSDGASFTIDSFARYLVHDPVHHLWDVRR